MRSFASHMTRTKVTNDKSRIFICLQPLFLSLLSFSDPAPFVFKSLRPLFPKYPGVGYPCDSHFWLCSYDLPSIYKCIPRRAERFCATRPLVISSEPA